MSPYRGAARGNALQMRRSHRTLIQPPDPNSALQVLTMIIITAGGG